MIARQAGNGCLAEHRSRRYSVCAPLDPRFSVMTSIMPQLARFGPERCESLPPAEARAWCVRLARRHHENFSVLTRLTPARLRDDFAAVYAFCRWADDLGDETGDPERSRELLSWWRRELQACYGGEALLEHLD